MLHRGRTLAAGLLAIALTWHVVCAQEALPDKTALQLAEAQISEQYETELNKALTAAAKLQLANKLQTVARLTPPTEPATRFVLLRKARDLAAAAGDATTALAAVDALTTDFKMSRLEARSETLAEVAQVVVAVKSKSVAELAIAGVDEARAAGDESSAKRFAEAALVAARKARDPALLKTANSVMSEFSQAEKQEADVRAAYKTLADKADDPAANLTVGRHLCLVRGDWEKGLPHLALGSDAELQAAAQAEAAKPTTAGTQLDTGDLWWALSEKAAASARRALRDRALHWYKQALPSLTGLTRTKIERRLAEVAVGATKAATIAAPEQPLDPNDTPRRAAIVRGLVWLAKQQQANGSWSFATVKDAGTCKSSVAATSMALIPLIRAGNTPKEGKHKTVVANGLNFVLASAKPPGDLRDGENMYVHALATIALCEVQLRLSDKRLEKPTQAAIDYIVYAQDKTGGGWRYSPGQPGDTSVLGWQLAALRLGEELRLEIPVKTLTMAKNFLNLVQTGDGRGFGYTGPTAAPVTTNSACTAIGLLSRIEMGETLDSPKVAPGLAGLANANPSEANYYFNYHTTRVLQKAGGEKWKSWSKAMHTQLLDAEGKGPEAGSWRTSTTATAGYGQVLGRLGETSLALMTLLVE